MDKSPYKFDIDSAKQATAVILREEPTRRMNYMKLLKLLAISERESLKDTGRMITGDRIVAMERGPLPSRVYNLIKGEDVLVGEWEAFIETERYEVRLLSNPGVAKLSKYSIEKLKEVARRHRDDDEWNMVDIAHQLPEWRKNQPTEGSSQTIPARDILDAVGRGEMADEILAEAAKQRLFDSFFERHGGCSEVTPS